MGTDSDAADDADDNTDENEGVSDGQAETDDADVPESKFRFVTGPLDTLGQQFPEVSNFLKYDLEKFDDDKVRAKHKKVPTEPFMWKLSYSGDGDRQKDKDQKITLAGVSWADIRKHIKEAEIETDNELVPIDKVMDGSYQHPEEADFDDDSDEDSDDDSDDSDEGDDGKEVKADL